MDGKNGLEPVVTEPTAAAHTLNKGDADAGAPLRFSAKRNLVLAQRLLRGEPLEKVSRETNVPVNRLSEWRNRALLAAEGALNERERDARDEETERLKAEHPTYNPAANCSPAKLHPVS
jgi:hypothetical protein